MEYDVKTEARKQYLKYFRVWFIIVAVLLVITAAVVAMKVMNSSDVRKNTSAPAERVYDYADVLTDEEEQNLRTYIAGKEAEIKADIVLVTINEDVESQGIGWDAAMMNYADDFYDQNNYGYNRARGDGVLLLDNWYEGQAGSWLSTCGSVYERFGDYEIDRVLDAVYYGIDEGAYYAYMKYVDTTCRYMQQDESLVIPIPFILFVPIIIAIVYALMHLRQSKAKDTTIATTYVAGGRPEFRVRRDDFIRKNVVTRRIQTNNGGGGGGRSGGGRGGSHRSSSGTRHGGGGRRR